VALSVCREGSAWAPLNLEWAEYNPVRCLDIGKFLKRRRRLYQSRCCDLVALDTPRGRMFTRSRSPQIMKYGQSLTTPAVSRVFSLFYHCIRPHFFVGAQTASFSAASVHRCHPNSLRPFPFINSVLPTKHLFDHDSTMMSYANSLLFREAGSLINRTVTLCTIARIWHPRTGCTAFLLLLSSSTELVVINLVPQHDPESDSQLASYCDPRLSQPFHQFAGIETL